MNMAAKFHSGSAEEYSVSAKKYRLSFTTDEMSQTDVANESGLYRSGFIITDENAASLW